MTRRAWLQSSTAALACLALPEYALGAAAEKNGASRVWMTKEISPEALVRIYEALGRPARRVVSKSGYESVLTGREELETMMMTYAGLRNKSLVESLRAHGVNALGVCGIDGGIVSGKRNPGFRVCDEGRVRIERDLSGKPKQLNKPLLETLLGGGYRLVLSVPIADEEGRAMNTENDEIVALLARELKAQRVYQFIEAPGLLEDPRKPETLLRRITPEELTSWERVVEGRMKRKLHALGKLFQEGSPRVVISDGRAQDPLGDALRGGGTVIERRKNDE